MLNQSVIPCLVLTVASWLAHRFLRRQVRWPAIPMSLRTFQFVVIHKVKGFSIVNEAEADVFLEFSCFFDDPTFFKCLRYESKGFPSGSAAKESTCIQETRIQSLGREDPLLEGLAIPSSVLAGKIPRTEEPGSSWGPKCWTQRKRLSPYLWR